jgi:SAM-dependent methyltransferase
VSTGVQENLETPALGFTGERIVPGMVSIPLFREHEARYNLAQQYVKDKVVVDVACGTGIGSQHLLTGGARLCIGLDVDEATVRYAQTEYRKCYFSACDAHALCLADSSADLIVSFETVEHVADPTFFLRECERVLKPGGILICSTPNRSVYRWFGKNMFHKKEFTASEFRDFLNVEFAVKEMYCQKEVFFPRHILERLVLRLVGWLGFGKKLREVFRPDAVSMCMQRSFDSAHGSNQMIKLYAPKRFWQPTYLVAVATKSKC